MLKVLGINNHSRSFSTSDELSQMGDLLWWSTTNVAYPMGKSFFSRYSFSSWQRYERSK